ncbi:MAG: VWA domain-containing protein [Thermoanaerobaculia bacterium]|nr:VWA domain-containing protein [Thermoanaerobaculia bacterium]
MSPAISVDDVVDAELQQLYVTVTRDTRRALDLGEGDFAVIDNGTRQELVTFARGDVPLAASVLVDASASMLGSRLRYALRGAAVFVQDLGPSDEASLLLFSDHLLHATPFANDPAVLTAGLSKVEASGGTALNDHLYLALKQLEKRQGRRVVIFLSDGVDSHSVLRTAELTWLARRSRALLYWIRTDPRNEERTSRFSAWKNADEYRAEIQQLTDTVSETGGRIFPIARMEDAEAAFREILAELREQYVLGYYPIGARNDGSWRTVTVRLRDSGLAVRTREGYLDY